jgi:hypothetical protein
MAAPRDFNFTLLDNVDLVQIQGRSVPKLTFLNRPHPGLAHVYVMSTSDFNWPGEVSIPSATHDIQIRRSANAPDFFYMVIYTGGSLDQFMLQGI